MLSYHPAFDPAHTSLRMIRILIQKHGESVEEDRLRICDFYLLFPHLAASMRLPQKSLRWRPRLRRLENHYWFSGEPLLVFRRISPIQEAGLTLLETVKAIERIGLEGAPERYRLGAVPADMLSLAKERNAQEQVFVKFLNEVLMQLPLGGIDGLKHRTGLMEYRYDET